MRDDNRHAKGFVTGDNAKVVQTWNELVSAKPLDVTELRDELRALREAVKGDETMTDNDRDAAAGELAQADNALEHAQGDKALGHLKNAGKWVLEIAEKIGVKVAAEVIRDAMKGTG